MEAKSGRRRDRSDGKAKYGLEVEGTDSDVSQEAESAMLTGAEAGRGRLQATKETSE